MIRLKTSLGNIDIELDTKNTPKTAENFINYVQSGFYNGTIFHRVMDGFMIQGGGHDETMAKKTTQSPIENEAKSGQQNKRGTVAMARTSDPHSATSQFFINVVDNDFLNFKKTSGDQWGYCVFGTVIHGMDVVDKIKAVPTTSKSGHQNVPVDNVVIESAEILDSDV